MSFKPRNETHVNVDKCLVHRRFKLVGKLVFLSLDV